MIRSRGSCSTAYLNLLRRVVSSSILKHLLGLDRKLRSRWRLKLIKKKIPLVASSFSIEMSLEASPVSL